MAFSLFFVWINFREWLKMLYPKFSKFSWIWKVIPKFSRMEKVVKFDKAVFNFWIYLKKNCWKFFRPKYRIYLEYKIYRIYLYIYKLFCYTYSQFFGLYINNKFEWKTHSIIFYNRTYLWYLMICTSSHSEVFRGILCNFIEIALRHRCSPVNLLHIFRALFLKNTSGWLLLDMVGICF